MPKLRLMEDIFKNLQEASKNEVDTLTKWLKDSKLVESTKEGEEKARALFNEVKDKNKIELENFKDIVKKLADEQKKTFEELSKKLADEGPKLMDALAAGVSAFKDALAGANKK